MKQKADNYQKLTDIEHVLHRPSMYIGSMNIRTDDNWIFDEELNKMIKKQLSWVPSLLKLFDEVISNAVDESKRPGRNLDTIKVDIDKISGKISIFDNGGIIVEEHPEYKEYIPTMIFGNLRAGSNFDDSLESTVAGQNGIGASLTNIFSKEFIVETCDTKKRFKQIWTDNMNQVTQPQIIEIESKGFTKITFSPDYEKLNTTLNDDNYNKIVKRVYDVAGCNPNLKIYLNGKKINIKSFKDYIELYRNDFVYDENENWQIGVAPGHDGFEQISFVNSTETTNGGTHVNYVVQQIISKLREFLNKKHKIDVKPSEIQAHLALYINCTIVKPRYDSQVKDNLITETRDFKTSWDISDKFIKKIIESGVIEKILAWAEAKAKAIELEELKKLNKSVDKQDPKRVDKFSDALEANDRHLCELYLSEGLCLEENTEIISIKSGELKNRKIADIRPGDYVLTHLNRFKKVTNMSYSLKDLIKIKTPIGEILASPEHRLLSYDTSIKEFKWVEVKNLNQSIHKLIKSTLVDIIHAEIINVEEQENNLKKINYNLDNKIESYIATHSHKFHVFDINDLQYKLIEVKDIIPNYHFLSFRYKYIINDRRIKNEEKDKN